MVNLRAQFAHSLKVSQSIRQINQSPNAPSKNENDTKSIRKRMADDVECDDQWLYGDNPDITPQASAPEPPNTDASPPEDSKEEEDAKNDLSEEEAPGTQSTEENNENKEKPDETDETEKQNGDGSDKEDYDEDSDDDVNVVIGDIKTSPAYTSLNIKRGGLLTTTAKGDKGQQPQQSGKFSVEEFDQAGSINGVPVSDFNLDSVEDKAWRKPGADITDYFNYGFNEDTWRAYCERQKRMRVSESGTGLLPLNAIGMPRGPVPIMNDNSKYSGSYAGLRKAGPPPGRRMAGSIDVIGGATTRIGAPIGKIEPPKENVIQVMTADRREYSRKQPGFPDMSVPPPSNSFEEFQPEYGFNPEPEPFYGGYEPTQDCQWGTTANPAWQPQEIKTLTPAPPAAPIVAPVPAPAPIPPVNLPMPVGPVSIVSMPAPSPIQEGSPTLRSKSKDRDRESSRREIVEKTRDRERERSHRRERSRSRSHRHKSRSRSPGHRSHRKKKSRRHEESE